MSIFSKKENESFEDYCGRMAQLRIANSLTWQDVADIVAKETGIEHSESFYRRKWNTHTIDESFYEGFKDEEDDALIKLRKEKAKISDERVQVNALIRRISREDTIKEIAKEASAVMSEKLPLLQKRADSDLYYIDKKEGLLLLSDWHYGVNIENFYNVFNPDICRERVNTLKQKVIEKCELNGIHTLNVANLGDMVAGRIHLRLRLNSRIDVITQIMEVSEILAEFIHDLSEYFTINYFSVDDNHSRIEPNISDSLELESLYRITNWYLRSRLSECSNVHFYDNEFGDGIAMTDILGYNIAFVHGHKDAQATILTKLNNFTKIHFDVVCSAHMHHFSSDESCDTFMIANGGLMGTDDYAFNKRLTSAASQTLIIVAEDNPTEAIYRIIL